MASDLDDPFADPDDAPAVTFPPHIAATLDRIRTLGGHVAEWECHGTRKAAVSMMVIPEAKALAATLTAPEWHPYSKTCLVYGAEDVK